MANSLPNHWLRAAFALLAAASTLLHAAAADTTTEVITFEASSPAGGGPLLEMNGTLHARNVILRQAPSTLISAAETSARGLAESYENSHWEFKGSVHIEYEGTILDADAATVTFADNHIRRIHVTGSPARFSHQPKKSERRNEGRAGTIDYDAAKVQVRLAGGTWYSDGRNEVRTAVLVYNTTDGSFTTQDGSGESDRVSMTIRPGTRVPPPRTPERETAQ